MPTITLAGQQVELGIHHETFFRLLGNDTVFPRECADIKVKFLAYWELIVEERKAPDDLILQTEIEIAGLRLASAIEHRNQLRELVWKKVAKRRGILGICGRCGRPIIREQLKGEKRPEIISLTSGYYGFAGHNDRSAKYHHLNMILLVCEHCQDALHEIANVERRYLSFVYLVGHPWPALPMSERWSRIAGIPPAIRFSEYQREHRVICLPNIRTDLVYIR